MKHLYRILLAVFFVTSVNSVFAVTNVTNTLANFNITNGGTKFNFDIYCLRTSPADFRMGSTSYIIKYNAGTMTNPVISNVNPKYTVGSPTGSYNPMGTQHLFPGNRDVVVQVYYNAGAGDVISNVPGTSGLGERIATVTLDILAAVPITLTWDTDNSAVVSPGGFETAISTWVGSYTGTLPVELASFNSTIHRNNVKLLWSTSSEVNNSGFDVERKIKADETAEWSKVGFVNGNGNSHEARSYEFEDRNLNVGRYVYRLKQIDFNGNFEYFELSNEVVVGVPVQFELSQNYPNPFNPSTKINFSLPSDSKVTLNIFDISGRLVSTLLNNEFKTANYYTVSFNGANLSSGTYFYSIRTDKNTETKKMVLIK